MQSSVTHGTFTVERRYDVDAARVFKAWTDPEQIREWAAPAEGWTFNHLAFDFQVGGVEIAEFGPKGEVPYRVTSRFDDIRDNQRIVSAYAIAQGKTRISSSIMCVELTDEGTSTVLRITEHGAFFDGLETAEIRKGGVLQQLAQLQAFLALKAAREEKKRA
jgi:uncharacterized protein YndB with AHSA1/START domain